MTIISEDADGSDIVEVLIRGNGGYCSAWMDSLGHVDTTDCVRLTNSKKIKILCTKKKEICKTEKEIYAYHKKKLSSPQENQDVIENYTQQKREEQTVYAPTQKINIIDVADFILDYEDLKKSEVCISGHIVSISDETQLLDINNPATRILIDVSKMPRSLKKEIMQKCTFLGGCNNIVCGYADNSLIQLYKTLHVSEIK